MDLVIRKMKIEEYPLLNEFLYNAIFIPKGVEPPSKEIIKTPELVLYIKNFGKCNDDNALVAELDGKLVGAVWTRIMDDYGHIDDSTPSLAISLVKEYRNKGIGTSLMKEMLKLLQQKYYKRVSLSVQKANCAVSMYKKLGFRIFEENELEYIMICDL